MLCYAHLREYKRGHEKTYRKNSADKIKTYRADWTNKNRNRVNELSNKARKRQHRTDPRKSMLRAARKRAQQNKLEFSISLADIHVSTHCPLLNIPLTVNDGKLGPGSPTLDRVFNDCGYVPGNVIVISYAANRCKGNLNADDILKLAMNLRILEAFRGR